MLGSYWVLDYDYSLILAPSGALSVVLRRHINSEMKISILEDNFAILEISLAICWAIFLNRSVLPDLGHIKANWTKCGDMTGATTAEFEL